MKKTVSVVLTAVFCLFCIVYVLPNLPPRIRTEKRTVERGVMELWHVETFEGGSASIGAYLRKRATEYERLHAGLFVQVSILTYEQMLTKLSDGESFDVISFSGGVGNAVLPRLRSLDVDCGGVFPSFARSGEVEGKVYGVPYLAGAYGLFVTEQHAVKFGLDETNVLDKISSLSYSKKVGKNAVAVKSALCGKAPFCEPFAVDGRLSGVEVAPTQYSAYEQFVAGKCVCLIGTQRDIFRLSNKVSQGKMQVRFFPLGGYTDLVQYVGVSGQTAFDSQATEFCRYLLTEKSQNALCSAGMFSVCREIYSDGSWYFLCQSQIDKSSVPNVFRQV